MTDLAFHIREFVPECDGEEMEQRVALLKARDYAAMLRARSRCEVARDHAMAAHDAAAEFVFSDASPDTLNTIRDYCRHLVQAAFLADQLELLGEAQ